MDNKLFRNKNNESNSTEFLLYIFSNILHKLFTNVGDDKNEIL